LAKCRAGWAGPDIVVQEVILWSRDTESGYYWRSTQEVTTDRSTGSNKKDKPVRAEKPCRVSDESDYDYTIQFTGLDGNNEITYLRIVDEWQE
jgi:hypothetical protein